MWLARMIWVVSMPVSMPKYWCRVRSAMTTSSRLVLPARSPIPLTVTSTCRAPALIPARLLAVAIPRSSWQWVDQTTSVGPRCLGAEPADELEVLLR